jgi:hypothetical protein
MAGKSRTELKTQTDSALTAVLTLSTHRSYLKDDMIESAVLRKDVIASQTPSGGNVAVDFSSKDLCTVTTTGNLSVSFLGMDNGDVKYLAITKNAGNTISFTGSTDVSPRRDYIDATALTVIYKVANKNGTIWVCAISIDFDFQPDLDALETSLTSYIDNEISTATDDLITVALPIGAWDMDANSSVNVSYTIPSGKKIIGLQVVIFNDVNNDSHPLNHVNGLPSNANVQGGFAYRVSSTRFELSRLTSGFFDSTLYDDTGVNRGYITFYLVDV